MKFVLVFAVLFIAIYLWRKNRRDDIASRPPPPEHVPRFAPPESMQRCAHCGLHLPEGEALPGPGGAFYCSSAHRQAGAR